MPDICNTENLDWRKAFRWVKTQSASRQMDVATLTFDKYFYAYIKMKFTRVAIQEIEIHSPGTH